MKMCKMLLVLCCCLAITTGAGAAVITGDPGGNFNVEGPADDFVNWASTNHSVSVEAGQIMMETLWDSTKPTWYTTSPTNGTQADLDILFTFDQPLITARLDFGSIIQDVASGDSFAQLEITAASTGIKTLIYFHDHLHAGGDYNYDPTGFVSTGSRAERNYTFVNIDALVAGETQFTLNMAVQRSSNGTEQWGASFMGDREALGYDPESDFFLSGTMVVPEPATMTLLALGSVALIRRKRS